MGPSVHAKGRASARARRRDRTFRSGTIVILLVVMLIGGALAGACGGDTASSDAASSSPSPVVSASPPLPGYPATPPAGAPTLTAEEEAWLAEKGTLEVGAFNDYPPFSFQPFEGGEATGIAVDYWKLIAYRLGVEVAFTPTFFSDQLEGLKDGRFDSLTGIFPLEERKQWFAFTRAWFMIDTRIFTDAAHKSDKTLASLKGLTVSVVKDDSGQQIADDAGLETLVVESYPEAVKAVGEGRAQAMILDQPVGEYYVKEFGYKGKVAAVGKPVASGEMTLPVRKDDTVLLAILQKGIGMVGEAEFEGIYETYMGAGGD
jgi:polar amino acid transport system substrate-binding protein